jgi:hypothetical protein
MFEFTQIANEMVKRGEAAALVQALGSLVGAVAAERPAIVEIIRSIKEAPRPNSSAFGENRLHIGRFLPWRAKAPLFEAGLHVPGERAEVRFDRFGEEVASAFGELDGELLGLLGGQLEVPGLAVDVVGVDAGHSGWWGGAKAVVEGGAVLPAAGDLKDGVAGPEAGDRGDSYVALPGTELVAGVDRFLAARFAAIREPGGAGGVAEFRRHR